MPACKFTTGIHWVLRCFLKSVCLILCVCCEWFLISSGSRAFVRTARLSTSLSSALVVSTALLDTHISFCVLHRVRQRGRAAVMRDKPAADPILNDMEYILPRVSFNQQPLKGVLSNLLDKQTPSLRFLLQLSLCKYLASSVNRNKHFPLKLQNNAKFGIFLGQLRVFNLLEDLFLNCFWQRF